MAYLYLFCGYDGTPIIMGDFYDARDQGNLFGGVGKTAQSKETKVQLIGLQHTAKNNPLIE